MTKRGKQASRKAAARKIGFLEVPYSEPRFPDSELRWWSAEKKERVVSETKRKNFSGEFKAKVAIEGIRGIKTVNVVVRNLGCIPHRLVRNFP